MKKYLAMVFVCICAFFLAACGKQETYEIEILIPAGSTEAFVYSDEEICPTGDTITISAGAGIASTEAILKPVNEELEMEYTAEPLTQKQSVKLDAVKGEWFKIGVAMQNDSEKGPIAVSVKVEGVDVRIAERGE